MSGGFGSAPELNGFGEEYREVVRNPVYRQSYLLELWSGPTGPRIEEMKIKEAEIFWEKKLFGNLWMQMRTDVDEGGPHINTDYLIPSTGQQWKDLATKRDPITGKRLKDAMHPDHRIDVGD